MLPLTSYYICKSQRLPSPCSYFADASSLSHKNQTIGFILKLVDLSVYGGIFVYMGVQVPMKSQRDAGFFYPALLCLFVCFESVSFLWAWSSPVWLCWWASEHQRLSSKQSSDSLSPWNILVAKSEACSCASETLGLNFLFCSSWMSNSFLWITCQAKLGDSNVEKSRTDSNRVKVWAHSYEILLPATMVNRAICYKRKNIGGCKWLWC